MDTITELSILLPVVAAIACTLPITIASSAAVVWVMQRQDSLWKSRIEGELGKVLSAGGLQNLNPGHLRRQELAEEKEEAISELMEDVATYVEAWEKANPNVKFEPKAHLGKFGIMTARCIASCPALLKDIGKIQKMISAAL